MLSLCVVIGHGWSDLELFGVDADRPYTRIDQLGLVPALDGCKIISLSAEGGDP